MQLGEAVIAGPCVWPHANLIPATAATQPKVHNGWCEFLSPIRLFGEEFIHIKNRKGRPAQKGWAGGSVARWSKSSPDDLASPVAPGGVPRVQPCWEQESWGRSAFFSPPLISRRDWKKMLLLVIINHSETKPGLAELTVQSSTGKTRRGKKVVRWFLDVSDLGVPIFPFCDCFVIS